MWLKLSEAHTTISYSHILTAERTNVHFFFAFLIYNIEWMANDLNILVPFRKDVSLCFVSFLHVGVWQFLPLTAEAPASQLVF